MPAALLMSTLQAALQPLMAQNLAPGELCQRLNRILCDVMPAGKFISFFYGVLDSAANRLTYCNAGHNPPLLVRADGVSSELGAEGAVLGQFPEWQYHQVELPIEYGDRLLLFTDGLVEASDTEQEAFGEQSIVKIAAQNDTFSATDLMQRLMSAASQHCGGHFQDDASLIVLRAAGQAITTEDAEDHRA
jgi:serine phosphatase RsbU (regulator of sigma subunit)